MYIIRIEKESGELEKDLVAYARSQSIWRVPMERASQTRQTSLTQYENYDKWSDRPHHIGSSMLGLEGRRALLHYSWTNPNQEE